MVCASCNKQKANLHAKKSKVIPTMTQLMCEECIKAKMEPRYVLILAAQDKGLMHIADYVKHRRYIGKDILAREVM